MVSAGFSLDQEDFWKKNLGDQTIETIATANLCLVTFRPSKQPQVLDAENKQLSERTQTAFQCLLLNGIPAVQDWAVLTGSWVNQHVHVRSHGSGDQCFRSAKANPKRVTQATLVLTGNAADAYETIFGHKDQFLRLKRGFQALVRAVREDWPDFRLHQYVRAIEALTMTQRDQAFAYACAQTAALCGKIILSEDCRETYTMRGCVEHMHDWTSGLRGGAKFGALRKAHARLLVVEDLALACYRAALTSPALLE